jgi:hypothetical protein
MVILLPSAKDSLKELLRVLLNNPYCLHEEKAHEYVDALYNHVVYYIPLLPGKKAPERFNKYGRNLHYITYRPNRQTTWYIFYIQKNDRYLVTYITNNHVNAHHIQGLR